MICEENFYGLLLRDKFILGFMPYSVGYWRWTGLDAKHKEQVFQIRSAVRTQLLPLSPRTLSGVHGFFGGRMEKEREEICSFLKIQILALIGKRKVKTSVCVCVP